MHDTAEQTSILQFACHYYYHCLLALAHGSVTVPRYCQFEQHACRIGTCWKRQTATAALNVQ
jgi:hypothetical protein